MFYCSAFSLLSWLQVNKILNKKLLFSFSSLPRKIVTKDQLLINLILVKYLHLFEYYSIYIPKNKKIKREKLEWFTYTPVLNGEVVDIYFCILFALITLRGMHSVLIICLFVDIFLFLMFFNLNLFVYYNGTLVLLTMVSEYHSFYWTILKEELTLQLFIHESSLGNSSLATFSKLDSETLRICLSFSGIRTFSLSSVYSVGYFLFIDWSRLFPLHESVYMCMCLSCLCVYICLNQSGCVCFSALQSFLWGILGSINCFPWCLTFPFNYYQMIWFYLLIVI